MKYVIYCLFVLGCKPANDPTASCEQACAQLEKLGCEEAKPTKGGVTCVQVCKDAEESGFTSIKPGCVVGIKSCEAIGACY